jgi:hypothetical protein
MMGRMASVRALPIVVLAGLLAAGCTGHAGTNPSFDVSAPEARHALRQMAGSPRPLDRPVVILAGMNDPGFSPAHLASQVRRVTGDRRILSFTFGPFESLDACARRVVGEVQRRYPGGSGAYTGEVDVIAFSLGGLVARAAAAPEGASGGASSDAPGDAQGGASGDAREDAGRAGRRRLRIVRLFTISCPHRGAVLAAALPALPLPGHVQADVRPGSSFLRALEMREEVGELSGRSYETCAYVRLGDAVVGASNASPAGRQPHWLSTPPLEDAHSLAFFDPRIVADIARRLRGEPPFAADPPDPLPSPGNVPPSIQKKT